MGHLAAPPGRLTPQDHPGHPLCFPDVSPPRAPGVSVPRHLKPHSFLSRVLYFSHVFLFSAPGPCAELPVLISFHRHRRLFELHESRRDACLGTVCARGRDPSTKPAPSPAPGRQGGARKRCLRAHACVYTQDNTHTCVRRSLRCTNGIIRISWLVCDSFFIFNTTSWGAFELALTAHLVLFSVYILTS